VAGDETAYRIFHEAYYPRLMRYLLVVTNGDEDAAREAFQVMLVRVVRHIKVFEDESQFWNWLTVLARTAFTDQVRKRGRYLAFLDRFTAHRKLEVVVSDDGDADARLLSALESSLRGLPADERQLLEQKYFGGESVRDLAAALETTEKAVESKLSRVRRKLKTALLAALKNESAH
jgi:RNA polymerase sigma factor (sigma-70 family)